MASRATAAVRLPAVDWVELTALLLTCAADAAIGWIFGAAMVAMTTSGDGSLPGWFPLAILLFAALVPRAAYALESAAVRYETIVGAAAAVSLAVSIKIVSNPGVPWRSSVWVRDALDSLALKKSAVAVPVWVVVLIVAAAWWRGRHRAEPGVETSFQELRIGIPLVFLGAALAASMEGGPADGAVARAALLFLLAALALVAFVRLTGLGGERVRRIAPMDVLIAALPLLAVALGGLVVVALVTGDVLTTVIWALHPLFWLLRLLLEAVLLVFVVLVYLIVAPIFWLIGRGHLNFSSVRLMAPPLQQTDQQAQQQGAPATIPDAIRYAIAAAALLLVFAGVNRFVFQNWRKRAVEQDTTERTTERPELNLGSLLSGLLGKLRPRGEEDPLAHLRGDPRWAATVRVRERYQQFLAWSAEQRLPRRPDHSPAEHRRALAVRAAQQSVTADLAVLTERYERARYALEPASMDDADAVDAAWRRLHQHSIGPT